MRRLFLAYKKPPRVSLQGPVIAVGNLTVGGTGKSVFVEWLACESGLFDKPAVLLGGYQSPILKKQSFFVVADSNTIFADAAVVGDEPLQIAQQGGIGVVIGKDRKQSLIALLECMAPAQPDVAILDDGYQTATIYKDCSILLVDARAPFGNGFLFPAGPLRERDYSRADIIVLTHADELVGYTADLANFKKRYFPLIDTHRIIAGRHAFVRCINPAGDRVILDNKTPVLLVSGIAKPDNLEKTAQQQNYMITDHIVFTDHHTYTPHDVENIIARMLQLKTTTLLTTAKDWTKLSSFEVLFKNAKIYCLIVKIRFEFLTQHEYDKFVVLLQYILERALPHNKKG